MRFDLDEFLQACVTALAERDAAVAVEEVVQRAISDPAALDAALGTPKRGGLHTLHRSPEFTVLHVVWPPRVRLYPHDHRMWAANGIYVGHEDNTLYRRLGDQLVTSGRKELETGTVLLLGDDAIHAVTNPSDAYAAAIHVYGGDYFGVPRSEWDPVTFAERPFAAEHIRTVLAEADAAYLRR